MSTLSQFRDGLTRAWETVTDGWRELVERAGDAITRFHAPEPSTDIESRSERLARRGTRWSVLAAEVSVDGNTVRVAIEVPGMEAGDFDINVHDDVLVVRGEKRIERVHDEGRYHVMERAYGAFERAVRLPVHVEDGGAAARYERGVLNVELPVSPAHRVRRIPVVSG